MSTSYLSLFAAEEDATRLVPLSANQALNHAAAAAVAADTTRYCCSNTTVYKLRLLTIKKSTVNLKK